MSRTDIPPLLRDVQSSPSLPIIKSHSEPVVNRKQKYSSDTPKEKKRKKRRKTKSEINTTHKKKKRKKKTNKIEAKEIIVETKLTKLKAKLKNINEFNQNYEEIGKEIGTHNYKIVALLGTGAQGRVYLVRLMETGDLYAMKVFQKEIIIENDKVR